MLCPTHLKTCADKHALQTHHEARTARNKKVVDRGHTPSGKRKVVAENATNNPRNNAKKKDALVKRQTSELQVFESVFMYYKVMLSVIVTGLISQDLWCGISFLVYDFE